MVARCSKDPLKYLKNLPSTGIAKMCFAFFCAVNITGDIKNSIQNWQNLNKIDQSCGNIESIEKTEHIMQMSGLGLLCVYTIEPHKFRLLLYVSWDTLYMKRQPNKSAKLLFKLRKKNYDHFLLIGRMKFWCVQLWIRVAILLVWVSMSYIIYNL